MPRCCRCACWRCWVRRCSRPRPRRPSTCWRRPNNVGVPSPRCSWAGRSARCWACRCTASSPKPWAGAGPLRWWPCSPALAAWGVWRTVPEGVKPPTLNLASWGRVLTHPLLMGMVGVTLLSAAGQFTLFSYFAPYYRQVLGASAGEVSLLFFWFGAFGLLGNVLLSALDRPPGCRALRAHRHRADGRVAGAVAADRRCRQRGAAGRCGRHGGGCGAVGAGLLFLQLGAAGAAVAGLGGLRTGAAGA